MKTITNRASLAALGCAGVVLAAGCSSSSSGHGTTALGGGDRAATGSSAPTAFSVAGKVVVSGHATITRDGEGTECWTLGNNPSPITPETSAYDDVKSGAQVVIADAAGKTLGVGQLGAGVAGKNLAAQGEDANYQCTFPFTVDGVMSGSRFYSVKVADQPAKQFPAAAIRTPTVELG